MRAEPADSEGVAEVQVSDADQVGTRDRLT